MTESFNDSGAEFGEQRLVEALRRHRASQFLIAALLYEVRQFNLANNKMTSRSAILHAHQPKIEAPGGTRRSQKSQYR
jgi:hypothetical protein